MQLHAFVEYETIELAEKAVSTLMFSETALLFFLFIYFCPFLT